MKFMKNVENIKGLRKIFMGALVMGTLLFVSGCATKEQIEALEKIEEQAKSNAVDYISEKYGFEAEVVDVEGHTGEDDLFPNHEPTGYATVTVKHDGKEFEVYITGEEASSKGKDNYQSELILGDIKDYAMSVFDFEAENIYLDAVNGGIDEDIMISTYYDGKNMEQMLEEMDCNFDYKVVTLGADLQKVNTENLHDKLSNCDEIIIINSTDNVSYEMLKEANISSFWMDIYDYGMYMDECIYITARETEYIDLNMMDLL